VSKNLPASVRQRLTKLQDAPKTLQIAIDELVGFLGPVAEAVETGTTFNQNWIAPGPWKPIQSDL